MFPAASFIQKVDNGTAWTADTQIQSLTLLQYLRFKASNPSNSATLVKIYVFGGQASGAVNLKVNTGTTTSITTNTLTPRNQNLRAQNASALTVAWDISTSDIDGSYYRTLPINANFQAFTGEVIYMYPGQTLAFSCYPGLSATAIMHMSWVEQPLAQ